MEKLFIVTNSTDLSGIASALERGQDEANRGQRARTARLDPEEVVEAIEARPYGEMTASGGGVPNSYNYQATTTIVGVAWVTDAEGRKHVRVRADRVRAPKSSYGRRGAEVFPTDHYLTSVYEQFGPALAPIRKKDRKRTSQVTDAIRDHLREHADDGTAWLQLADLVEEMPTGRPDWWPEGLTGLVRGLFTPVPAGAR